MPDGFVVTGQRQTTIADENRQLRNVVEVSFRTDSGATGTVVVPLDQFTAENVLQLVAERALVHETVASA